MSNFQELPNFGHNVRHDVFSHIGVIYQPTGIFAEGRIVTPEEDFKNFEVPFFIEFTMN
jgi:hypothetical protein